MASLDAGRFYLRTTVEQDGTTLYRLLHQSLADYLRRYPMSVITENDPDDVGSHAGVVFDRLLGAVRAGRWGRWSSVPPYLLRHAIHHAIEADRVDDLLFDIEFLLHADRTSLAPELYRAKSVAAQLNAEVYFRALDHWAFRSGDPVTRRWIFAVEAVRHDARALGGRVAAESPVTGWCPRWSATPPFEDKRSWATAVSAGPVILVSGSTGQVWQLDPATGELVGEPLGEGDGTVSAVAVIRLKGHPAAVTGGSDGIVRAWDLRTGEVVRSADTAAGWINAIACTEVDDQPVAIVCGDGCVRIWDAVTGEVRRGQAIDRRWTRAIATATVKGRAVAVTGSNDQAVRIWELAYGTLVHPPMRDHRDRVYAVACTTLDGKPVAVTGGDDDRLRLWDLATGRAIGTPLAGHESWISAVVCTEADGRAVAISGSFDRTVRVWDLGTGQCTQVLVMPSPVWAMDIAPDNGLVVCTGRDVLVLDQLEKGSR